MERIKNIFLKNLNLKQAIFKNTFWIGLSEGITAVLKFFLLVFAARVLGATKYGQFSFAFSFVIIFSFLFDFGLSLVVTREISKEPENKRYLSDLLFLKIILGLIALFLIFIGSFFITQDYLIRKTIMVLGLYLFGAELISLFYAVFRGYQKMEYEAWFRISQAVTIMILGLIFVKIFYSALSLGFAYFIATFFTLIAILPFFYFKIFPLRIAFHKAIWLKFLKFSWPLALIGGLDLIYNHMDSVMLGFFGQITQTGLYNAAYKIIGVTLLPMTVLTQSFFPALSKFFKESKEKLQKICNFQIEVMVFLSLPLFFGGIKLAPKIIGFFYTPEFMPAVLVFQLLMITVMFIYIYIVYNRILIVFNQQKKLFLPFFLAAVINLVLNLILIPKFSFYGAAVATVITHFFIFCQFFFLISKYTSIKPFDLQVFKTFVISFISALIMYSVLTLTNFSLFIAFSVGIFVYLICFFGLRKILKSFRIL